MRSDLPKVMHPLAGRPMVRHVVDVARGLDPRLLAVVVGYGAELVRAALDDQIVYATQAEQLGTAHAVRQAEAVLAGRATTVLVLYGDTPLILPETLRQMVDHHATTGAAVTILSFQPEDPAGYGRIVRDAASDRVLAIVEDRQASIEQRAIREVNSGIFCFADAWLWSNLNRLPCRPGGEWYLTDLVGVACEEQQRVETLAADALEVMGLDDRAKLAQADGEMRRRINRHWMLSGVSLVDPGAT
jgi:bifunctional UDP-N-acetylglucosamine pyrophosphorylase/glucosamine-1-phosphate N-acetyltransferase